MPTNDILNISPNFHGVYFLELNVGIIIQIALTVSLFSFGKDFAWFGMFFTAAWKHSLVEIADFLLFLFIAII